MSLPIAEANAWYSRVPAIGPHPEWCLCGAMRGSHNGAQHHGAHPPTGCRRYRKDIAYDLAVQARRAQLITHQEIIDEWQAAEYPRPQPAEGGWGVGPSDFDTCRRSIYYREMTRIGRLTIELAPTNSDAALIGQLIHDAELRARKRKFPWRLYETLIRVPGLDRPGRCDEFDPVSGEGVDLKTMGEPSWSWLGDNGVKDAYWKQLAVYLLGLQLTGHHPRSMRIIAIRRSSGEREEFTRPWTETYARQALAELLAINTALDWGEELPRDHTRYDNFCREYCEARIACWNLREAADAGMSPEGYTFLGPKPNADEIAFAAKTIYGWQQAKKEAKEEYDAKKTWLVGVPPGEYGDYTVTPRSRKMPDHSLWHAQVLQMIANGATPEQVAAHPVPKRPDAWIAVGKVRAAKKKAKTT